MIYLIRNREEEKEKKKKERLKSKQGKIKSEIIKQKNTFSISPCKRRNLPFLRTYKYGFIGSNNFIFGSDEATFHGVRDNVSSVYSDACPVRAFGAYRLLRLDVEVQTASISFKTYRMDYPRHAAYASNHRGILRAGTFV